MTLRLDHLASLAVVALIACTGTAAADDKPQTVWSWKHVQETIPLLRTVRGAGEFPRPARNVRREPYRVDSDTPGIVIVAAVVDVDGSVVVAAPVKKVSAAADAAAAGAVLEYRFRPCSDGTRKYRCGDMLAVPVRAR